MPWSIVLLIMLKLIDVLGPKFIEWAKRLLEDAAREMPPASRSAIGFENDVKALFANARGKTGWLEFRKRRVLRLYEAAVLARSVEVCWAARGDINKVPDLLTSERDAMYAAF